MISREDKKEIEMMMTKALEVFRQKNLGFRNQRLIDTPTDSYGAVNKQNLDGFFPSNGGTFNDGANLVFGTGAGTKIGTSTSQKIGFYGKTPISQQANTAGNVSAGSTYTSVEQAMLNDSYSVLRNLGLLS